MVGVGVEDAGRDRVFLFILRCMNSRECTCPSLLTATGMHHRIRVDDSNSFILEQKSFPLSLPFIQCLPCLLFSLKLRHKNINVLGFASQRPVMPSVKLQTFRCQSSRHGASRSVPLAPETSPSLSLTPLSSFALFSQTAFLFCLHPVIGESYHLHLPI